MRKYIYLLFLLLTILCSCHKEVYLYKDDTGSSKYTLYKTNFRFDEKTMHSNFTTKGKYEIVNGQIIFDWKDWNKIPYYYQSHNYFIQHKNTSSATIEFKIIDKFSHEPIIFGLVLFRNTCNEIIGKAESDLDGNVFIPELDSLYTIEINMPAYANYQLKYANVAGFVFDCELEKLDEGGRMSEGCLIHPLDLLLKYTTGVVDGKLNYFEYDNRVYKIQKK